MTEEDYGLITDTAAATTNADVYYEGRAIVPLVVDRVMPILPEEERRLQRQVGSIEFANHDGELDSIAQSYAVDGRDVVVKLGERFGDYDDFGTVGVFVATGWETSIDRVILNVRDRGFNLDTPLQTSLYDGSGGADGTAEIEGRPKPLCFGVVRNVTPLLIDPTNLIYQVHDGALNDITDVYDRGAALTDSTDDVATYAALVSQGVAAGEFATANAVGMFKLGSSPDGLITCDVEGDATGSYVSELDDIISRVLENRAGISSSVIDDASFTAINQAYDIGLYLPSTAHPTGSEVMSALLATAAATWGTSREGMIKGYLLEDPTGLSPDHYLDEFNVLSINQESASLPRWRQSVGYQTNWTVQRGEDIAGAVSDDRRQFLTQPQRVVSSADADTLTRHPQALDAAPLPTLYDLEAPASALAASLLSLHCCDRRLFSVVMGREAMSFELNDTVRLTWPRLGLSNGVNFSIVGLREDTDRDRVTLTLWG